MLYSLSHLTHLTLRFNQQNYIIINIIQRMTSLQKFLALHTERKTSNQITIKTDNVFTFGKYKDRSYDEIYDTDKSYIAYVMGADSKFWRRPQVYFLKKIEDDETKI